MTLRVEPLTGPRLSQHLGDLARLRIEVFRDFPYLYEGSFEYEEKYLANFANAPDAVIVAAIDGDQIVGASTAAPLDAQAHEIVEPFRQRQLDTSRVFYFGESVLRLPYRGRGIGVLFFRLREGHARACGASVTAFCSVIRPPDHPQRPPGYKPLDHFWAKRGYAPARDFTCEIAWRELGETQEAAHPMQFWLKKLPA